MGRKVMDLTGRPPGHFGLLTPLERVGSAKNGSALWRCRCECGNEKRVSQMHLCRKIKPVRSCGCLMWLALQKHWVAIRKVRIPNSEIIDLVQAGRTHKEVAELSGVTRQRIGKIVNGAIS